MLKFSPVFFNCLIISQVSNERDKKDALICDHCMAKLDEAFKFRDQIRKLHVCIFNNARQEHLLLETEEEEGDSKISTMQINNLTLKQAKTAVTKNKRYPIKVKGEAENLTKNVIDFEKEVSAELAPKAPKYVLEITNDLTAPEIESVFVSSAAEMVETLMEPEIGENGVDESGDVKFIECDDNSPKELPKPKQGKRKSVQIKQEHPNDATGTKRRKVSKVEQRESSVDIKPIINRRFETCEICGKTFTEKWKLQQHEVVHSGESTQSSFVLTHFNVNFITDLRPFVCHCGSAFKLNKHLIRHQKTHSKS